VAPGFSGPFAVIVMLNIHHCKPAAMMPFQAYNIASSKYCEQKSQLRVRRGRE
jgi:hypothetical protein